MNINKLFIALSLVYTTSLGINAQAGDRCPAGESGCTIGNASERIQDRVNEGAKKVISDENINGRLNEVKDTIKDCVQCGADAIRDGMDNLTSNNGGNPN
jgi:hypothetical protein